MIELFIDLEDGPLSHVDDFGKVYESCNKAREDALEALHEVTYHTAKCGDGRSVKVRVRDREGAIRYSASLTFDERWAETTGG